MFRGQGSLPTQARAGESEATANLWMVAQRTVGNLALNMS